MRSFVGTKREAWRTWAALDAEARRVVAMVAGDRSEYAARRLWDALPDEYRAGAVVFSDFWAAYAAVVPESRHVACGEAGGMTCHVERFWCAVRRRCARFARETLSSSKCHWNHTGSLWCFIHHYNASLP